MDPVSLTAHRSVFPIWYNISLALAETMRPLAEVYRILINSLSRVVVLFVFFIIGLIPLGFFVFAYFVGKRQLKRLKESTIEDPEVYRKLKEKSVQFRSHRKLISEISSRDMSKVSAIFKPINYGVKLICTLALDTDKVITEKLSALNSDYIPTVFQTRSEDELWDSRTNAMAYRF